jgi:hypothetical protein
MGTATIRFLLRDTDARAECATALMVALGLVLALLV